VRAGARGDGRIRTAIEPSPVIWLNEPDRVFRKFHVYLAVIVGRVKPGIQISLF